MPSVFNTAGERLVVDCAPSWIADEVAACLGLRADGRAAPTLNVSVEASHDAFPRDGLLPIARGTWARGGVAVITNVGTSGFDAFIDVRGTEPRFTFRWRPDAKARLAKAASPSRHRLLTRAVLVQYPALWRAALRGRTPVHAAACTSGRSVALLSGPGGVGKTTLVLGEVAAGERTTGDNVAVTDGTTVWGLAEPARHEHGGRGPKMPHGRTEAPLQGRVASLIPDRVVVLRRGDRDEADVRLAKHDEVARTLIAGTYAAQELRRFWSLVAVLSIATESGPAHPTVVETLRDMADRLPGITITLPRRPGPTLRQLLDLAEVAACA
jgi:hypothetical protein